MVSLYKLQKYLDNLLYFDKNLDIAKIDPHMANGLMVKGRDNVSKVGFSVSASLSLFEKARAENCDGLIVHHSFNLPAYPRYDEVFQRRILYLINNHISLFGYHFLLDGHPEIGNNVEILKLIGAKPTRTYLHRGNPWGWTGTFDKETPLDSIIESLEKYLSEEKVVYRYGGRVKKVTVVTGKGAPYPTDMQGLIEEEIDLFITGEVHEWNRELFREAKINFIAGGHYQTEVFGVKKLMEKVKKQFSQLNTVWLDLYNKI